MKQFKQWIRKRRIHSRRQVFKRHIQYLFSNAAPVLDWNHPDYYTRWEKAVYGDNLNPLIQVIVTDSDGNTYCKVGESYVAKTLDGNLITVTVELQ